MRMFFDIETRSTVDLRRTGQYVYAADPSTEILMLAWALDNEPVRVWLPVRGEEIPDDLAACLADPAVTLVAHNAAFERVVCTSQAGRKIGLPVQAMRDMRRWNCTAARAACMGLPRTLDGAGRALNLDVEKDRDGHALMMRMCKPRASLADGTVTWWEDAERMGRLAAYCRQDVEVERLIDRKLPDLPPAEHATWLLTEAMNDTGVTIDEALLLRVAMLIEDGERALNAEIAEATGGAVRRVTDHAALTRWLTAQGIDDAAETGVGKAAIAAMLDNPELDPTVRQVLVWRQEGGKSSAAKYRSLMLRMSDDRRIRGALVYCGAAATGRWSSRGAQLQNLPRGGALADPAAAIRDLADGATLDEIGFMHGPPLVVASELLRPTFVAAPGHWLARGDYSQIEARVLAWLAGQANILDAFRAFDAGTGPDLYKITAAGIYGVSVGEVTKEQRQIGKVAALALGYQGGKGAFLAMAKAYGVRVSEERAEEIKTAWRAANPMIASTGKDAPPGFWRQLESAAADCMARPAGAMYLVGPHGISFRRNNSAMALRLPSGRSLVYWNPKLAQIETPWGMKWAVKYRAEDAVTKRWTEFAAYGGLWTENVVQATARELMADSLIRCASAGLRPILTVHDEAICEVSRERFPRAAQAAEAVEAVMREAPVWAAGLPVAADASADARYVKG